MVKHPHRAKSILRPSWAAVKMPGVSPKLSETPGGTRWPGPTLGQHTDAVLADLGYGPEEIAALRNGGGVA